AFLSLLGAWSLPLWSIRRRFVMGSGTAVHAEAIVKPRLVFFHSLFSGQCRRVEGFLAQVLQRRRNHGTFQLYRVASEERPDLVARDLHVLGRVAVARIAARLLGTRHLEDALHQRADDAARLLHDRRRRVVGPQALLHAVGVLLGLQLVLLELPLDVGVVRRR